MTTKRIRARTLTAALLATAALGTVAAYSQGAGPLWDPAQLPATRGTVKQYTLTPRGDVDGLILSDGTEVKLPPHLRDFPIILHPYARAREGVARNVGLQTIKAAIEKAVMQRGSYP